MESAWQDQGRSRAEAAQVQSRSRVGARAGQKQEQGRSRIRAGAQYQSPYQISSKLGVKHKVEIFCHWSVLVSQPGCSKIAVAISNSFYIHCILYNDVKECLIQKSIDIYMRGFRESDAVKILQIPMTKYSTVERCR